MFQLRMFKMSSRGNGGQFVREVNIEASVKQFQLKTVSFKPIVAFQTVHDLSFNIRFQLQAKSKMSGSA